MRCHLKNSVIIIIIIIIIGFHFMRGIYNYIPQTNQACRV